MYEYINKLQMLEERDVWMAQSVRRWNAHVAVLVLGVSGSIPQESWQPFVIQETYFPLQLAMFIRIFRFMSRFLCHFSGQGAAVPYGVFPKCAGSNPSVSRKLFCHLNYFLFFQNFEWNKYNTVASSIFHEHKCMPVNWNILLARSNDR